MEKIFSLGQEGTSFYEVEIRKLSFKNHLLARSSRQSSLASNDESQKQTPEVDEIFSASGSSFFASKARTIKVVLSSKKERIALSL